MEELYELIATYGKLNDQIKALDEECKCYKEKIKEIMISENLKKEQSGDYSVSCVESHKQTVDEVKMLAILDKYYESSGMENPFSMMVRVLDSDSLEKAIYNDEIPKEVLSELNGCIKETVNHALKCTHNKEA